jgi:hypothetical protein
LVEVVVHHRPDTDFFGDVGTLCALKSGLEASTTWRSVTGIVEQISQINHVASAGRERFAVLVKNRAEFDV